MKAKAPDEAGNTNVTKHIIIKAARSWLIYKNTPISVNPISIRAWPAKSAYFLPNLFRRKTAKNDPTKFDKPMRIVPTVGDNEDYLELFISVKIVFEYKSKAP